MRIRGVYLLEPAKYEEQLPKYISRKGKDNIGEDFRIDTIKIFSEGSFILEESFESDYLKANGLPENYNGARYWQDKDLIDSMVNAMNNGFDVHIHAMGDGAVKQSVCTLVQAQEISKVDLPRNVIAHLMLVKDADAKLMGEKGIIANCQPRWMVYDSDVAALLPALGKTRTDSMYPLRKFIDNNVIVAFGTDFPVTPPPDTMHEIQCCMTRSVFPDAPDYEKFKNTVLGSEKRATLKEAVKSLSINGAYQMRGERFTGSIEEGKSADLIVLDSSIEEVPVSEIYKIKVKKTLFKGRVVYEI